MMTSVITLKWRHHSNCHLTSASISTGMEAPFTRVVNHELNTLELVNRVASTSKCIHFALLFYAVLHSLSAKLYVQLIMAKKSLRVSRRPLFLDEEIDNTITVSPLKELDFEYPPPPPPPHSPSPDPFNPTKDLPPLPAPVVSKQASKQHKKQIDRLFWTFEMEMALFETLVGQCRLGLRADSGYKAGAWNKALEIVHCSYYGIKELLTVDKLKSKLSNY